MTKIERKLENWLVTIIKKKLNLNTEVSLAIGKSYFQPMNVLVNFLTSDETIPLK